MTKTFFRLGAVLVTSVALTLSAYASNWTGAGGNWSDNTNPGWNGTGVPNAIGAVANFPDSTVGGTSSVDVLGGATIGTFSLTGTGNFNRNAQLNADLTFNQDGAGAGFATISNSNPNTGTTNFISIGQGIGGGNFILADDLHIVNTGGGTNTSGAILIGSVITGTGNLTLSNASNTFINGANAPGAIRISNTNSFVGSVLIQKGMVTLANDGFNSSAMNPITLGQAGQGSASLMSPSTTAVLAGPITVAAATGGTNMLGTAGSSNTTFSSAITLNGNLTINSFVNLANSSLTLSGVISGVGGLSFISGATTPATAVSRLTNTGNTYSGGTLINVGTLIAAGDGTLGTGNVSLTAAGVKLTLQTGVLNNYIADAATLSLLSTDTLNLNFTGTDTVGQLVVNGVAQAPGLYNSGNLAQITGTGALNVLGVPEPQTFALIGLGSLALFALRRKIA